MYGQKNVTELNSIREHLEQDPQKADVLISRSLRNRDVSPEMREALLILQARAKLKLGRPQEALDALSSAEIHELTPAIPAATLELLGDAFLARFELAPVGFADHTDLQKAQTAFEIIMHTQPDYDNIAWIHYQLGRISLISDDVDSAERYFIKGLEDKAIDSLTRVYCFERLGYIAHYEQRDPGRADKFIGEALALKASRADLIWRTELLLMRSRIQKEFNITDAITSAKEAVRHASEETNTSRKLLAESLLNLAELLFIDNHFPDAIVDVLERFFKVSKQPIGIDVTWSRAFELLGASYSAMKRYSEAIKAFQNSLDYNPYHPWEEAILCSIGHSYYELGAFDTVVQHFEDLIAKARISTNSLEGYQAYHLLANSYFVLGRYPEAITAYEQVIQIAPEGTDVSEAHKNLELARLSAGER